MTIFLGADHNGHQFKEQLEDWLKSLGHEVVDSGNAHQDPNDDFPQFASRAVTAMLASHEKEPRAILICGSGQGMCIAANRYKGVRAALAWNESEAKASRNDDDSNVLCLAARETRNFSEIQDIVKTWLDTPFAGAARFVRRIKELDELN